MRIGSGTAYDFEIPSDQHGTDTLYLDGTGQIPTRRQQHLFGNPAALPCPGSTTTAS